VCAYIHAYQGGKNLGKRKKRKNPIMQACVHACIHVYQSFKPTIPCASFMRGREGGREGRRERERERGMREGGEWEGEREGGGREGSRRKSTGPLKLGEDCRKVSGVLHLLKLCYVSSGFSSSEAITSEARRSEGSSSEGRLRHAASSCITDDTKHASRHPTFAITQHHEKFPFFLPDDLTFDVFKFCACVFVGV
jgi:hypothetical protein